MELNSRPPEKAVCKNNPLRINLLMIVVFFNFLGTAETHSSPMPLPP